MSMSRPPATMSVSTGPATSASFLVVNSRPLVDSTGPPATLTSCVSYWAASTNLVVLEKTSSGPVTSRIWAESKVTMTTRCPLMDDPSSDRRPSASRMAEIVYSTSFLYRRCRPTVEPPDLLHCRQAFRTWQHFHCPRSRDLRALVGGADDPDHPREESTC